MKRPMAEVLAEGKEDLITILVSSGINCVTCQFFEGDMACEKGVVIGCAEINLCFKWRQKANKKPSDSGLSRGYNI